MSPLCFEGFLAFLSSPFLIYRRFSVLPCVRQDGHSDDPPSYTQATGRQHSVSVLPTSSNPAGRLLARQSYVWRWQRTYPPVQSFAWASFSAHFLLPTKDVPTTDIFYDFKNWYLFVCCSLFAVRATLGTLLIASASTALSSISDTVIDRDMIVFKMACRLWKWSWWNPSLLFYLLVAVWFMLNMMGQSPHVISVM